MSAIQLLEPAIPYELGRPRCSIHGYFGALYPVYVRGEAQLAANRGAKAALQFQKILDHPGILVNDPIRSLARLQLARALALKGDNKKLVSTYREFLGLWENADADIPIFGKAQIEYANLMAKSRLALLNPCIPRVYQARIE